MAASTAALTALGILAFISLSGCLDQQDGQPRLPLPTVGSAKCSLEMNYDRCMTVNFNDGSDEDILGLNYVDGEEDNMMGKLVHGRGSVTVTLDEDVACFTISKSPTRTYMFTVDLGTGESKDPEVLPPGQRLTYVQPPSDEPGPSEEEEEEGIDMRAAAVPFPPQGFRMKIYVFYDVAFERMFGTRSSNTIDKVFAHVNNLFSHASLDTTIKPVIIHKKAMNQTRPATRTNIYKAAIHLAENKYPEADAYVLLSVDNGHLPVGISFPGATCAVWPYRISIAEYQANDLVTAQHIVHEIGHNLGMKHDFDVVKSNGRYLYKEKTSSKGKLCTQVGGFMDYVHPRDKWSDCSVEEFAKYFRDHQPFCLEEFANN